MNPWQLVENGQYQEALDAYAKAYKEDHQGSNFFKCGMVYLLLGDYSSAIKEFELVIPLEDPKVITYSINIYFGICYWYLNQPSKTVEFWKKSLKASYTDAAGGAIPRCLLLYAAERINDESLRKEALFLLQKQVKSKYRNWPAAIPAYLLNEFDTQELENIIASYPNEILRERYQCQADFYIALKAFRENDKQEFETRMKSCVDSKKGLQEKEYYLARWEVQHNFPDSAFS